MSLFEALYGKNCNTPVSWDNTTDKAVVGLELLKEMEEHIVKIKKNLKASQYRQNNYADRNKVFRDFKLGEYVFLKFPEVGSEILWDF
jgi:hypothetical protein